MTDKAMCTYAIITTVLHQRTIYSKKNTVLSLSDERGLRKLNFVGWSRVLGQSISQTRWRHLFHGQVVSWLCVPKWELTSVTLHRTSALGLSEMRVSFDNSQLDGFSHLLYSLTSPSVKSCSALLYSFYRLGIVLENPIFFISWVSESISLSLPPPPSHSNFRLKIHCLTCSQKGQSSAGKSLSHKRTQWPTLWTV